MTFYSQKILQKFCWLNCLPKRICSSKTCSPKFPPKKISFKKNCSPFCSPNFHPKEFAPQFFPPKNLLSNIFALHISSDNEFYLQKFLQNIFAGEISSSQESLSKTWSPKFPLKKICFKKKLFPPPIFFHSKEFAPQIFPPKICCQTFLLSILLLTKNCFTNFAPQKSLLPKSLCGAVMAPD